MKAIRPPRAALLRAAIPALCALMLAGAGCRGPMPEAAGKETMTLHSELPGDFRLSNTVEIERLGSFEKRFELNRYEAYAREAADAALRPAPLRPNPSFRYFPEVDDFVLSGSIERTPGGRIYLAWFGGGDNDRAVLLLAKSDDGGETFSPPLFVQDAGYVDRTHISTVVGCLWTDPDGRLWLFYTQSLGYFDGRGGIWHTVCDDPDAAAPVWSPPVRLWHGSVINKPIVLADGSWLLASYLFCRNKIGIDLAEGYRIGGSRLFPELDPYRMTNIFLSRDRGRSWTRIGGCQVAEGQTFDEPMAIERRDGTLWLLQRTVHGIAESVSTDGGRRWSEPVPFPLPAASARFFLRRLASGRLLLVRNGNPDRPAVRSHLTACLSDDDGRTWYGGLLLDDREKVSYPDGFQAPDGRIFIQYDHRRQGGEILLAVFTEADVAAGRPVSGQVRLRHPAIRTGRALAGADPLPQFE